MLNSIRAKPKKSHLEMAMSKQVVIIFGVLVCFCLFAALFNAIKLGSNWENFSYLGYDESPSVFVTMVLRLGNWILIFG